MTRSNRSPGGRPSDGAGRPARHRRVAWIAGGIVLLALIAGAAIVALVHGGRAVAPDGNAALAYVGSETCAGCHSAEFAAWQGSQHRMAMDHATGPTVLGDFSGATFDHFGVQSRFFRDGEKFLVETDGPDGRLATFEVKYTFGVEPLQQYLIEFPDGRIQALSIAWDSRPAAQGGQRWFHLYPDEPIPFDDELHWTRPSQNWNHMCAECHSTGVAKNYDAATDSFHTSWAEISVGCETCHGQGSRHLAWAEQQQSWWPGTNSDDPMMGLVTLLDERHGVAWTPDPETAAPRRSTAPATLRKEVETCGLCHARRGGFADDWKPGRWLSQTHIVTPLERGLFHADGQMLGEVYNYAPFKQSKMFAAGVTCSDCHDPHSGRTVLEGNATCLQCHGPERYETPAHHHHAEGSAAAGCPACHMPVRTYMVVDPRHDHSFRVPRPDLSVSLGTPNACNDCHQDQTPEWAAAAVEGWFGPAREGFQTYAPAFHAAWADRADSRELLAAVAADPGVPAIARASALPELAPHLTASEIGLARDALGDPEPMVRIGALDMIVPLLAQDRLALAGPLLADPVRGVRIRAAELLADLPPSALSVPLRERFERAAADFVAFHRIDADRAASRAALGSFYSRRGMRAEAEAEFQAALRLEPGYPPAAVNLADHYRQTGFDERAEQVLESAIEVSPDQAGLHHALGLTLVRARRYDEAVAELRRAAELEPGNARYAYVYAVALHSTGHGAQAIALLEATAARHPADATVLVALVNFHRDAGDTAAALGYAGKLLAIAPDDPQVRALVDELKQSGK